MRKAILSPPPVAVEDTSNKLVIRAGLLNSQQIESPYMLFFSSGYEQTSCGILEDWSMADETGSRLQEQEGPARAIRKQLMI